jgi:hypothetical protein
VSIMVKFSDKGKGWHGDPPGHSDAARGIQTVRTGKLTERERESLDFDFRIKHQKELIAESEKLYKQYGVERTGTFADSATLPKRLELNEVALQRLKQKYGITEY